MISSANTRVGDAPLGFRDAPRADCAVTAMPLQPFAPAVHGDYA
ncbi:hypothetical protein QP575_16625 [Alcaligenes faecalis subsp. phenolicus]|nr:hypothetical protein [Alcaligenes phenolicus]